MSAEEFLLVQWPAENSQNDAPYDPQESMIFQILPDRPPILLFSAKKINRRIEKQKTDCSTKSQKCTAAEHIPGDANFSYPCLCRPVCVYSDMNQHPGRFPDIKSSPCLSRKRRKRDTIARHRVVF